MTGENKDGTRTGGDAFVRIQPGEELPKRPDYGYATINERLDDRLKAIREMPGDTNEKDDYRGGSYGELKEDGYGWPDYEVHHIPADSTSELPKGDGPAIVMDYDDHKKTASWGMTKEAIEYRQTQKDLIAQGKFIEAVRMDIDDLHEKFGDKYDGAIKEMLPYADKVAEKVAEKHKEENHVEV